MKKIVLLLAVAVLMAIGCAGTKHTQQKNETLSSNNILEIFNAGDKIYNIDEVINLVKNIPQTKDEYETSDQFAQRVTQEMNNIPQYMLVSIFPNIKYVEYNADRKELKILRGSIGYTNSFDLFNRYSIIASSKDLSFDSYVATNAYGAKITVARITKLTKKISKLYGIKSAPLYYLGKEKDLFAGNATTPLFNIENIEPQQARKAKENLRITAIIKLQPPYYRISKAMNLPPTFNRPMDIDETEEEVFADIFGVVFHDSNKETYVSLIAK